MGTYAEVRNGGRKMTDAMFHDLSITLYMAMYFTAVCVIVWLMTRK
jgi:hypothetical protein